MQSTPDELAIYDDVSRLGQSLWEQSLKARGLNTDPKMMWVMLYKRLWSNHRGFTVLHNNSFELEGSIILRAGIEAAICIAANYRLRDGFVVLMRQDAAQTLQGQIKLHRADGNNELVRDSEAMLRMLQAGLPNGSKPAKLDWQSLAEQGCVPQLYGFHRMLSGASSHVTGLSILRGVVSDDGEGRDKQDELRSLNRKMHPMMMAGATLQASMLHSSMIEDDVLGRTAAELASRMNELSLSWPGVEA